MLVACIAFGPSGEAARAAEVPTASTPMALTSAPPAELFSVFNPNHLYLDNGVSTISVSTGKVTVAASTTANKTVASIGIVFYVQKWNGSSWENVGAGSTTGTNSASSYHNSFSKSVTAGYYYRGRTVHWVIENGVYEEGEVYTGSVLGT